MRPYCHIRLALAATLVDGPGTCAALARRVNEPVHRVRTVLDNMVRAGDAAKAKPVRLPHCKRPVPVYCRASREPLPPAGEHVTLLQQWLGQAWHGAAQPAPAAATGMASVTTSMGAAM